MAIKKSHQVNTVNVVEVADDTLQGLRAFSDDTEGNKEAERLFRRIALENGAKRKDIDDYIMDGHYGRDCDKYDLYLTHAQDWRGG